ncbi:MAG: CvpA family protein [Planctomycetota bacterium]
MHYILLIVPWFATFAMTVQLGLWSNAILLAQIVFSGLVAFGFYQPLAVLLDEQTGGEYTYFMDFLSIWALYCGSMLILKILDGALSKKRVRFQKQVDQIGGPVVGFVSGAVMTGIVMASLHAAPLSPETMKIDRADIATTSSFTAPDLAWLRLVEAATEAASFGSGDNRLFVEDYVVLYASRREAFAETDSFRVKRSGAR